MQDEGVGALQSDNYILVWPRKVWTSRVVPYQISGHHAGNIRKFFIPKSFWVWYKWGKTGDYITRPMLAINLCNKKF